MKMMLIYSPKFSKVPFRVQLHLFQSKLQFSCRRVRIWFALLGRHQCRGQGIHQETDVRGCWQKTHLWGSVAARLVIISHDFQLEFLLKLAAKRSNWTGKKTIALMLAKTSQPAAESCAKKHRDSTCCFWVLKMMRLAVSGTAWLISKQKHRLYPENFLEYLKLTLFFSITGLLVLKVIATSMLLCLNSWRKTLQSPDGR